MVIIFRIDKVEKFCFVQCQSSIYKYEGLKFYCKQNIKFCKRMKLNHEKTKKIYYWSDRQGIKHDIEGMTNQHVENSMRFFFENNLWKSRTHQIKFLFMEKRRRIRLNRWNLSMANLGKFGDVGKEQMNRFLKMVADI